MRWSRRSRPLAPASAIRAAVLGMIGAAVLGPPSARAAAAAPPTSRPALPTAGPAAPGSAAGRSGSDRVGRPSATADTAVCELRLEPAEAPIREAAVLVSARASREPGALRGVVFPRASGVRVLNAAPAPDHDEVVARMALDTSGASPGRWDVLLRGGERSCRGTLRVRRGEG